MRLSSIWSLIVQWIVFGLGSADELIFSQALFRHGERSPSDPFKNAPLDATAFPMGIGRVTYRGLHQSLSLGRWLRSEYIDGSGFLSAEYKYDEIFVRSSDHSRTIQSAYAFLAGLYPAYPRDQTAAEVEELPAGLVPIPVYVFNAHVDKVNRPIPNCRRAVQLQRVVVPDSAEGRILTHKNADFLERLSNLTGQRMSIDNSFQAADYIEAARRLNLSLPVWTESVYEQSKAIEIAFLRLFMGIDMQDRQLRTQTQTAMGGGLLNELVDRMFLKADCLNATLAEDSRDECSKVRNLRLYAYSSHDVTISGLFAVLGADFLDADRDALPEFSAMLLIELWKQDESEEFVVKWKYRRPSILNGTLVELEVPDSTLSSLHERAQLVRPQPNAQTWCDEDALR